MQNATRLGAFQYWLAAVAIGAIAVVGGARAQADQAGPKGTIAVGTTADFRTIVLISPATRRFTGIRAPDTLVDLKTELTRDGTKIAIAGLKGIWIVARNGSGARRILNDESAKYAAGELSWSPSGNALTFTRAEALFTVAANGQNLKKIFGGRAYAPDWSPSDNQIVFVRNPAARTGAGPIHSIGTDGRNLRSLLRGGHPDVSPDGSKLAFARPDGIYVAPMERGTPRRIVRNAENPEWSPDGRYLAFTRSVECGEAGCSGRVFIVPVTGGRAKAIGPSIFDIGALSWSR